MANIIDRSQVHLNFSGKILGIEEVGLFVNSFQVVRQFLFAAHDVRLCVDADHRTANIFKPTSIFMLDRTKCHIHRNFLKVCYLITMILLLWTWEGLLSTCKHLHQTYGPDLEIPSLYNSDVLQLFDDSNLHESVFRVSDVYIVVCKIERWI